MDIPHLHDIHPCPNWGTCKGIGMENVETTHLSQRGVISLNNNGDNTGTIDTWIPALLMSGRADNGTASSTLLLH